MSTMRNAALAAFFLAVAGPRTESSIRNTSVLRKTEQNHNHAHTHPPTRHHPVTHHFPTVTQLLTCTPTPLHTYRHTHSCTDTRIHRHTHPYAPHRCTEAHKHAQHTNERVEGDSASKISFVCGGRGELCCIAVRRSRRKYSHGAETKPLRAVFMRMNEHESTCMRMQGPGSLQGCECC